MGNQSRPVGLAPALVAAASVAAVPCFAGGADSIIVPEARDRMLELIEREQLPTDVRMTLAGALSGDLGRQQLLFQAMIDTWPRLQKALGEVKRAARKAPWQVRAWAPRGGKPGAAAETLARKVEEEIWAMRPDPIRGEKGRGGFRGEFRGVKVGFLLGNSSICACGGGRKPDRSLP